MSSPRENTQAMAICEMVTPLGVCDGLDRVNDGKVSVKVGGAKRQTDAFRGVDGPPNERPASLAPRYSLANPALGRIIAGARRAKLNFW